MTGTANSRMVWPSLVDDDGSEIRAFGFLGTLLIDESSTT